MNLEAKLDRMRVAVVYRKTVIIAEHRLEWLMDLADRVIYIKNGRIINDYTIKQFKKINRGRGKGSDLPTAGAGRGGCQKWGHLLSLCSKFILFLELKK